MEEILELLSSGTQSPGRNLMLCCILELLLPEFPWIQHKPQHYLLEGFPAPKPLDFQHTYGGVCWNEFPTGCKSCPATAPMGCGGKVGKSSPHQGHYFGLLAHPQRRQHWELVSVPSCRGNPAKEPRSDIILRKQENFNMFNGNDANKPIRRRLS